MKSNVRSHRGSECLLGPILPRAKTPIVNATHVPVLQNKDQPAIRVIRCTALFAEVLWLSFAPLADGR